MQMIFPSCSTSQILNCIKIRLLRRPQSLLESSHGPDDFVVWGYFDWVSLEWEDDSLRSIYLGNQNPDPKSAHYEEQFLHGYTYDKKEDRIIHCDKPLLIITEIKLHEQFIAEESKKSNNPLLIAKRILTTLLNETFTNPEEVYCQIFNSLGYSDLLLVLRSSSYGPIQNILWKLKNLISEDKVFIVKSTYSILGVHEMLLDSWTEESGQQVSIQMSLKPGITPKGIKEAILNKMPIRNEELCVYPIFGKYDVQIMINRDHGKNGHLLMGKIAKLYLPNFDADPIFSPDNTFHKEFVRLTETQWIIQSNESEPGSNISPYVQGDRNFIHNNRDIKSLGNKQTAKTVNFSKKPNSYLSINENDQSLFQIEFERLWKACHFIFQIAKDDHKWNNKISENNSHSSHSLLYALQDILKKYWQITYNETINPYLRSEIGKILATFIEMTLVDMGIAPNKAHDLFIQSDYSDISVHRLFNENSFELAVYLISELILSWAQATDMILETPIYHLDFVNSSSKIYICYNAIVELIEKAINEKLNDPSKMHPTLNYFTMIHHAEMVKAYMLYPEARAKQRLIAIRLDRSSFFSPIESIPLIAHEIGHFIAPSISTRNSCFLKTICFDIARRIFSLAVIGTQNGYMVSKVHNEWGSEATRTIEEIQNLIYNEFQKICSSPYNYLDEHDPFFEIFCKQIEMNAIPYVFGFKDDNIESASIILSSSIDSFFEEHYDLKDHKTQIEGIVDWLTILIDNGESVDFASGLYAEAVKSIGIEEKKLTSAWDQLVNAYRTRKNNLYQLAENISKTILNGINPSDYREADGNKSLIPALWENAYTDGERKYLSFYFANRQIQENTYWNQRALKERIFSIIIKTDFTWFINFYLDLYREITADLFMIHLLGLSPDHYKTILNNRSTKLAGQDELSQLYDPIGMRKAIILRNWKDLVDPNTIIPDSYFLDNNHNGISGANNLAQTDLLYYLSTIVERIKDFCKDNDIQRLRESYHSLQSADGFDHPISAEIKFVETYWRERLTREWKDS